MSCPAGPSASKAFLPRAVPSTRWELTNASAKVRLVSSCCRVDMGRDAISAATACKDSTNIQQVVTNATAARGQTGTAAAAFGSMVGPTAGCPLLSL